MTRHIEPYRYEVQRSDDADFVAYQRKSGDGVWQTISVWMIPNRPVSECWPAAAKCFGLSASIVSASSNIQLRGQCKNSVKLYSVQCFICTE